MKDYETKCRSGTAYGLMSCGKVEKWFAKLNKALRRAFWLEVRNRTRLYQKCYLATKFKNCVAETLLTGVCFEKDANLSTSIFSTPLCAHFGSKIRRYRKVLCHLVSHRPSHRFHASMRLDSTSANLGER